MRDLFGRASRSAVVRLGITAAILAYLATRIDMAEAARAVAVVSRTHLALTLVLVAVDRAVMILRWILLLRAGGIPIATPDAIRLFLVSSFVGSFLPAGVGADAVRAYGLAREATTGSEAGPTSDARWSIVRLLRLWERSPPRTALRSRVRVTGLPPGARGGTKRHESRTASMDSTVLV